MSNICICICTRNRQKELTKLLDSLSEIQIPPDTNIRIIVVENDLESYSEQIISQFSSQFKIEINYFLETKRGISFARNRAVKEAHLADFCCFVDDDQIVAKNWLVELLKCQREFNADGVWGPNPPIFNSSVPPYVIQFHNPKSYKYGANVTHAFTNCLLLTKEYLDKIDGPFDERLNFTGGEDICLTTQISKLGGNIRYNPHAIANEIIPKDRTTVNYIAKRCIRNSNTAYFVQSILDKDFNKFEIVFRSSMRLSLGLLMFFPFLLFGKSDRLRGLIKICNALGGFSFILFKANKFYK